MYSVITRLLVTNNNTIITSALECDINKSRVLRLQTGTSKLMRVLNCVQLCIARKVYKIS